MKQATIILNNLSTGYSTKNSSKIVASNINASIYSGELTCLLGSNGAGKSTLLRTLSAFLPAISGSVEILGKNLNSYSDKQLSRIIGVVLTERCNIRNMSVIELIGLGRSPYTGFWGLLGNKDKEIIEEAISQVGIANLRNRMIHTLSDGERQKVMIAKALAQQTPVIFLDEPTAFLDFPSKVEMMQLLHSLSRSLNKTIFLSTHDLELALQIADKVWLMDKEHGIITGTPEDLSISGKLSSFFSRKGISFDMESGLFRIENEFHHELRLVGHGYKYSMVRKALQRNGIKAERHINTEAFIECGNIESDSFIWHPNKDEEKIIYNIEDLIDEIKNSYL